MRPRRTEPTAQLPPPTWERPAERYYDHGDYRPVGTWAPAERDCQGNALGSSCSCRSAADCPLSPQTGENPGEQKTYKHTTHTHARQAGKTAAARAWLLERIARRATR